jgi:hypothetical protein
MAKRKTKRKRELAKPAETAPPMDYEALVTAIEQAHQTAQRQAVQASSGTTSSSTNKAAATARSMASGWLTT